MNAPAPAAAIAPTVEVLPLAAIVPSSTHIQELRRARFTKDALEELANSIRRVGVLQPIVVRPAGLAGKYELVAGERRWQAAKLAGLTEIRASVCVLSPEQVLEIQLIENLQREGLHELEEAEGYEELMRLKKVNAEALAVLVKKSRSYVYGRLKLLALCPEARKAFYAGELDASKALLIARIGHHDTQRQAMKDLAGNQYDGPLSYRKAHRLILKEYMLKLKGAPFAIDDATLLPKAGTCTACPKRTGNQKDLFADVKEADICTDPKCFADKKAAHFERKRMAAEKAGKKVITGAAAKAIFPHEWRSEPGGGYVGLDTTCWDDPKNRKVRELVAKNPEAVELIQHPKTQELVEAVRSSTLTEILNERGVKTHRQKVAASTAKSRKNNIEAKAEKALEEKIGRAQALAIFKAAPAKLGKLMLLRILEQLCEHYQFEALPDLAAIAGVESKDHDQPDSRAVLKKLETFSESDLTRALVATLICDARFGYDNRQAKACLAWVKVDLKKIEAQVRAEAKAAAERASQADKKLGTKWPFPTGSKVPIGKGKKPAKKSPKKKGKK